MKKTHLVLLPFLLLLAIPSSLQSETTTTPPRRNIPGATQHLKPGQVPEGLSKEDWDSIRALYEAGRHAVFRQADGSLAARNPYQRWRTLFDGRGFTVTSEIGDWTWGMRLERFGHAGEQLPVVGVPYAVRHEKNKVSYEWCDSLEEWFINDTRGLEQGWTVSEAPRGDRNAPLHFDLAVHGALTPIVAEHGDGVIFKAASGIAPVRYGKLKAWDADGKVLPTRFESVPGSPSALRIAVEAKGAKYPVMVDPIAQNEQDYLKASNTGNGSNSFSTAVPGGDLWPHQPDDGFGTSVAVAPGIVVVGAPFEDSCATGIDGSGPFFIPRNEGATGVAPDSSTSPTSNQQAQADNRWWDAGAVYIFEGGVGAWRQTGYFKAPSHIAAWNGNNHPEWFGYAVAVTPGGVIGETDAYVAVGAPLWDYDDTGAVFLFRRRLDPDSGTGVWAPSPSPVPNGVFLASDRKPDDHFGYSVALAGDVFAGGDRLRLLVGAPHQGDREIVGPSVNDRRNDEEGKAYLYSYNYDVNRTWSETRLKAPNPGLKDYFGHSVALHRDSALIGAPGEDSIAEDSGAAYVYSFDGFAFTLQATLKAPFPSEKDAFGSAVGIASDTAVVGAPGDDGGSIAFFADTNNHTLRMVTSAGVSTLAGTAGASGNVDAIGLAARFNQPRGVAVTSEFRFASGIFASDQFATGFRNIVDVDVFKFTPGSPGTFTHAVNGVDYTVDHANGIILRRSGGMFANGDEVRVYFDAPLVYVADTENHAIRTVSSNGFVDTLAGTGAPGLVNGFFAQFNRPSSVAAAITEHRVIGQFDSGTQELHTGFSDIEDVEVRLAQAPFTRYQEGIHYTLDASTGVLTRDPSATSPIPAGATVTVDFRRRLLYVADTDNHCIRVIASDGEVSTLAGDGTPGSSDGTGAAARFNFPTGIATDGRGNVFVADSGNHTIRKVTPEGVVTTVAGTAGATGTTNATGAAARFNNPMGVAVAAAGGKLTAQFATGGGTINTGFTDISDVSVHLESSGAAYVEGVDYTVNRATGILTRVAAGSIPNSANVIVKFNINRLVYVADTGNNAIRSINDAGAVTTLAGTAGSLPGSTNGTGASARFNGPTGIALTGIGDLVVADTGNHLLRHVTPGGVVSGMAGIAGSPGSEDGLAGTARVDGARGVGFDTLPFDNRTNSGAAYVYERMIVGANTLVWKHMVSLEPSEPEPGALFGAALSLDQHRLLVGAPGGVRADEFWAYPIVIDVNGASQVQSLAPSSDWNEFYGTSALGDILGFTRDYNPYWPAGGPGTGRLNIFPSPGSAHVFERLSSSSWAYRTYLQAAYPDPGDLFGSAVSLSVSGGGSVIGARGEASNATGTNGDSTQRSDDSRPGAGAAYVHALAWPEIDVQQPAGVHLVDESSTVDFGNVPLDNPAARTFTIKNTGGFTLAGLSVSIDGPDASQFSFSPNPIATSLLPGKTTTFSVTFTPTSTGAKQAVLHIASSDADESPFDIGLIGNATPPAGAIAFGASAYTVQENVGTFTIPVTRGPGTFGNVSVTVAVQNGTATTPGDYSLMPPVTLTWADGDGADKNATFSIVNTTTPPGEANEFFYVKLTNVTGGAHFNTVAPAVPTATVTIVDDTSINSDFTNPQVPVITYPAANAVVGVNSGDALTITGTATDNKGVKKVEYSLDGGVTFHDATMTVPGAQTTSWSAILTPAAGLVTGLNTVTIRVTDHRLPLGNTSSATRSFTVARPLLVNTTGPANAGTLTSGFAPSSFRTVGTSYTITATPKTTPAPGFVFTGWTPGGTSPGGAIDYSLPANWGLIGVTAASLELPKLTFTMREGLTLTANFIANPFAALAGTYNGLIRSDTALPAPHGTTPSFSTEGFFNATVQSTGAFSAKLTIDGFVLSTSGTFDVHGVARFGTSRATTVSVARTGKPWLEVALNLDIATPGTDDQITGTVTQKQRTVTTAVSNVVADRAVYSSTNPVPTTIVPPASSSMKFNSVFKSKTQPVSSILTTVDYPQGHGYGTITVTKAGTVSLSGVLADNTAVTASAPLAFHNAAALKTWPMFAQLYSARGCIIANVVFDHTQTESDLAAVGTGLDDVLWFRPYISGQQHYLHGWPEGVKMDLIGAQYLVTSGESSLKRPDGADADSRGEPLLIPDSNPANGNADLDFTQGKLTAPVNLDVSVSGSDAVTKITAPTTDYSLTITRTTGSLSGTFKHNADSTKPAFKGILYQKGVASPGGYGFFLSTTPAVKTYDGESGAMTLKSQE